MKKSKKMTKNNFKFFLKKPSELAESSELAASGLAKHPCFIKFLDFSQLSKVLDRFLTENGKLDSRLESKLVFVSVCSMRTPS